MKNAPKIACLFTVVVLTLTQFARATETRYRLSLANALPDGPAVVDLSVMDGKFVGGDVGIAPADVTALVRDGDKLRGKVTCTLDKQACWFNLDAMVRDGVVEGKYSGARGETKVDGTVTGTVATAAFPPSPEHPVGWRGDGTGVFPFTDPPTQWAPAEWPPGPKNIRWRMKFSNFSWGNAQPIAVSNRLFVLSESTIMACLNADTGDILWKKDMNALRALQGDEFTKYWAMWEERQKAVTASNKGDAAATARWKELDAVLLPKVGLHGDGCQQQYLKGYSYATPVTDGSLVYVKNGTGALTAVDPDGNVKWAHNIGYNGGHSSVASPCLVDGHLIVWNAISNGKTHRLSCFDAKTGAPVWQTEPRPSGPGAGCPSPIVLRLNGVPVILTACGDIVRASDGRILAKEVHAQNFSTPPFHDDVVFFNPSGNEVEAVRLTLRGDVVTATPIWNAKPAVGGKSSAAFGGLVYYDGYVYMLQQLGQFAVMDASTGEIKCAMDISPGKWGQSYPSLTVAGGRVHCFDWDGRGVIVKAGPTGEVIARNGTLGGGPGSPFFVGNRMYMRNSYKKWISPWVYCIEAGNP